jgi:hypothetical protein
MTRFVSIFVIAATVALLAVPASASQWGCKVLLCASSSNPTWRGVAACHPPMERLIDAMKRPGFSWPTCPEAGTGKPGYQRYAPCPAGYAVGFSEVGHAGRKEANVCIKRPADCRRTGGRGGYDSCGAVLDRIRRPLNGLPQRVENTNSRSRTWSRFEIKAAAHCLQDCRAARQTKAYMVSAPRRKKWCFRVSEDGGFHAFTIVGNTENEASPQ